MLRRNTRPEIGLVNGVCGVLLDIQREPVTNQPFILRIKFDNIEEPQSIMKVRKSINSFNHFLFHYSILLNGFKICVETMYIKKKGVEKSEIHCYYITFFSPTAGVGYIRRWIGRADNKASISSCHGFCGYGT